MSENLMLDLATTVMINKFHLDETEYSMFKFSEGKKSVTIGMTNGEIPITVTFPRDYLRFEEMKAWDDKKKEAFVRHAMENDLAIPEELADDFGHIISMVFEGKTLTETSSVMTEEELTEVEKEDGSLNPAEETAEEFEEKVEGKKKPKAKKKLGKAKKSA